MEKILSIKEVEGFGVNDEYHNYDGYVITTDKQTIKLGINNRQCCCENWGYLITEDDLIDFIGSEFKGLSLTDTALKAIEDIDDLHEGNVMFVNIETSNGLLQFVAYNEHNGYYGHEVVIISIDLNHSEFL